MPANDPAPRSVRFNPVSISHVTSSFTPVPVSDPQLFQTVRDCDSSSRQSRTSPPPSRRDQDPPDNDPFLTAATTAQVHSAAAGQPGLPNPTCNHDAQESHETTLNDTVAINMEPSADFTQSQPFPKRTRVRHKSEASPRRDTQSDSAMAVPEAEKPKKRRRHSSNTSEKRVIRRSHRSPIEGPSYQHADFCGQIQITCAVISVIVELMLLVHFDLPNHAKGLGMVAGLFYFLGGALGLKSAYSKRSRSIVACFVLSMLSVVIASVVTGKAVTGLVTLKSQTITTHGTPILSEEWGAADYSDSADYPLDDSDGHLDADFHDEGYDPMPESIETEHDADLAIYQLLYIFLITISLIEIVTALTQCAICCCTTFMAKFCFKKTETATTVFFNNSCPDRHESDALMDRDVLERGSSGEFHEDADVVSLNYSEASCDEVWVVPGIHMNNNDVTENYERAMEEFEPDAKGGKKKMKKKKSKI